MRWQIQVTPLDPSADSLGHIIGNRLRAFGIEVGQVRTARLFYLEGELDRDGAERLARELFVDPVVDTAVVDTGGPAADTAAAPIAAAPDSTNGGTAAATADTADTAPSTAAPPTSTTRRQS